MQFKKILPFFILFILIVFLGINNYIWLGLNQRPPVDDEAFHLLSGLKYLSAISGPVSGMFSSLLRVNLFYPPLFPLSSALVSLLFGNTATVFIMTNLIYLFGIFISLYLIGKKMGNRNLGVLAGALLSFYPMFFQLTRMFMLEIALTFMVTASIAVLLYSEGFKKLIPSLVAGLLLGSGLLTKQFYVIFITGPLFLLLTNSFLKADAPTRLRIVRNTLLFLLIGIIIAGPWYIAHLKMMPWFAERALLNPNLVPHNVPVFSWSSLFFYSETLLNDQVLWFFFSLFIFAIFVLSKGKKGILFILLLLWIIVPYLAFTFLKNKFWYYTLPSLSAIALVTASGIINIKRNSIKIALICAILVVGLSQYFYISYTPYRTLSFHIGFHTDVPAEARVLKINFFPMKEILAGVKYCPRKGDWKREAILNRIIDESGGAVCNIMVMDIDPNAEARKNRRESVVLTDFDNYAGANLNSLSYYFVLKNTPDKIISLSNYLQGKTKSKIHFIISPTKLENLTFVSEIKRENYSLIEKFVMPDKSQVYLYKLNEIGVFEPVGPVLLSNPSSGRIDVASEDRKFDLTEIQSNGVTQCEEWSPIKEEKNRWWMVQLGLKSKGWVQLWIEFTPAATGNVLITLRGSLYSDNNINRHLVYVDDVVVEGPGGGIENGSFEQLNESGDPVGWGKGSAVSLQTSTVTYSGTSAMLVWHDAPIVQRIKVIANKKYRVSAWFKPANKS
ncbi:MAG: hypothetical protein COV73_03840 [Candidatus Omnitrophica bacterium CG11_big_fil_rev_8_21_14_0_20_43_6]|nr:MAG: hypothetical protein COV73_03840 [Candidatus Omnitrophica bacterium CG11_big_fil_rev_8_21_14_0_20_43_6]